MALELNIADSVGFRHVVEDALSVLSGSRLAPERRSYVLADLAGLLVAAKRGSRFLRDNELFVASADRNAYESYRLLDRHLDPRRAGDWEGSLDVAQEALNKLLKDEVVSAEMQAAARTLLSHLLESLQRESAPGIPLHPEKIEFGN